MDRIAASRYIGKSARLRALLLYLCDQVIEHGVQEIHEQEVGRAVFGRSADYDTISDNIVRVHASLLRKRLDQYFSSEGRDEPIIMELPKGNYAPVFCERARGEATEPGAPAPAAFTDLTPVLRKPSRVWFFAGLAIFFAVLSAVLLIRDKAALSASQRLAGNGGTHGLWSRIFVSGSNTDIVMDDEGVGLYEELTGTPIALSDYFNRNYLRMLGANPSGQKLSQEAVGSIILKRQSSYASATLLWKLSAIAAQEKAAVALHFARDYSFRELQINNAVLLGNRVSNPWIEAFQDRLGLRWKYDADRGAYYPIDTWSAGGGSEDRFRTAGDGYAAIAMLPNLSGKGAVLILSTSGGSALNAAGDFLADNESVTHLKNLLPRTQGDKLSYFEALLRIKSRSRISRDTSIVICRPPRI